MEDRMKLMRNVVLVILVMLLSYSSAFGQTIESLAADYIVKEYCFAAAKKPIVFAPGAIQHSGSYALLESAAYYADGSSTNGDIADLVYVLCFEKKDQWHILYDLSRSDVPSAAELEAMKKEFPIQFPKALLPEFWQRLLK